MLVTSLHWKKLLIYQTSAQLSYYFYNSFGSLRSFWHVRYLLSSEWIWMSMVNALFVCRLRNTYPNQPLPSPLYPSPYIQKLIQHNSYWKWEIKYPIILNYFCITISFKKLGKLLKDCWFVGFQWLVVIYYKKHSDSI